MPYTSTHTGSQIDSILDASLSATDAAATYQTSAQVQAAIEQAITATKLAMFPIGSIYTSTVNTDPGTFIGGTWTPIQGKFLLAQDSTYTAGSTGGEATHTLTVNEMPSHTHTHYAWVYNGGNDSGGANRYGFGYSAQGVLATGSTTSEVRHYNGNTGGGAAHNNMPPYLAVYMWQRTA